MAPSLKSATHACCAGKSMLACPMHAGKTAPSRTLACCAQPPAAVNPAFIHEPGMEVSYLVPALRVDSIAKPEIVRISLNHSDRLTSPPQEVCSSLSPRAPPL